jgi:hypothetical protein
MNGRQSHLVLEPAVEKAGVRELALAHQAAGVHAELSMPLFNCQGVRKVKNKIDLVHYTETMYHRRYCGA